MGNSKMATVQEILQKCILMACLVFTITHGSPNECCESKIGWKSDSSQCNDGSKVNLNCSDIYIADLYGKGFYYIDNSSWLVEVIDEKNTSVRLAPAGEFCQAYKKNELNFLVCFTDSYPESNKSTSLNILFGVCSILSSIFLALTLIVYLILPQLRELQDKAIMSLCASFMIGFFILGVQRLDSELALFTNATICIFMGFLTYYSFLGAFFWMNIISFNIWKSLWFPQFNVKSNILFIAYSIFGWAIPGCFLIFALVMHSVDNMDMKPGFGEGTCWFNGNSAKWAYFYGPVSLLVIMNLVYLGLTSWKLWYQYGKVNSSNVKVFRRICLMYVKLSLIMGVTWIFEIMSFAFTQSNLYYWIIPDTLNVLQGVFIFCLFVLLREKVKKQLALRKPCNISFPKKWASCKDEEEWDENDVDNIELANTLL